MLTAIFMVVALIALATMVMRPKTGALFVWPVLLIYPHGLQAGWGLPMNIGLDDLFILFLLGLVMATRVAGRPLRKGPAYKLTLAMFLINLFACAAGLLTAGTVPGMFSSHLKEVLKQGILLCYVLCIVESIDTMDECWRMARWIAYTITAAGILAMVSTYNATLRNIFVVKGSQIGDAERAFGSLNGPNVVAMVMSYGLCISIMLVERARGLKRLLFLALPLTMVATTLFTQSRSGFFSMASIPCILLFMRGMRKWALGYVMISLLIPVVMPKLLAEIFERISNIFVGPDNQLSGDAYSRIRIWIVYLKSMTPVSVMLGQGHPCSGYRASFYMWTGGMPPYPHSGYMNLFCYWGIWGVAWWVALMRSFCRMFRGLKSYGGSDGYLWHKAGWLFLIVCAMESITKDTFQPGGFGLILTLGFLALTDRFDACARERALQAEYSEAELLYPPEGAAVYA